MERSEPQQNKSKNTAIAKLIAKSQFARHVVALIVAGPCHIYATRLAALALWRAESIQESESLNRRGYSSKVTQTVIVWRAFISKHFDALHASLVIRKHKLVRAKFDGFGQCVGSHVPRMQRVCRVMGSWRDGVLPAQKTHSDIVSLQALWLDALARVCEIVCLKSIEKRHFHMSELVNFLNGTTVWWETIHVISVERRFQLGQYRG